MRKKIISILILVTLFLLGSNTISVIKANETVSMKPRNSISEKKSLIQNKSILPNDTYIDDPISTGWSPMNTIEVGKLVMPDGGELAYQFGGWYDVGTPIDDLEELPIMPNIYLVNKDLPGVGASQNVSGLFSADLGPRTSAPFYFITNDGKSSDSFALPEIKNVKMFKRVSGNKTLYMIQANLSISSFVGGMLMEALGQVTMTPDEDTTSIKIETAVKNNSSLNAYERLALGSSYDTMLAGYDQVPIRLYGSQKGLQIRLSHDDEDKEAAKYVPEGTTYLLNYMFRTNHPVANWRGGKFDDRTSNQWSGYGFMQDGLIRGFPSITSEGDEVDVSAAGTSVTKKGQDTVIRMKTLPVQNFTKGTVIGYSFNIGLQQIGYKPTLTLDTKEGVFTSNETEHIIRGKWDDSDSLTSDLYVSIDGKPRQFVEKLKTSSIGMGGEFKYTLPISELVSNPDEKHTIRLSLIDSDSQEKDSDGNPFESLVSEYTLYKSEGITVSLDKKSDLLTGKDYTVTGTLSDRDVFKPTTIYYKKWDTVEYKQATVVNNGETAFSFVIPASEIPMTAGASHVFDIYAVNRFGLKSNVEGLKLSMNQTKPSFTLDSTDQIVNGDASEYEITLPTYSHIGLYYPLSIMYQVDNSSWKTVQQDIGTVTHTLDSVTGENATFKIPASEVPFGTNHSVNVKVKDRFDIESADSKEVNFVMAAKPVLTLENKDGLSSGEDQVVSGTVTTDYHPTKFQYKIVKNGETSAVFQDVVPEDLTIDTITGKFNFMLSKELLPKGASYEIFVKASDKYNQLSDIVSYKLTEVVQFKVRFLNGKGQEIHKDIILDRALGAKINLTKESVVLEAIEQLNKQYTMTDHPMPEDEIEVNKEKPFVEYKFIGRLTFMSLPEALDFGTKHATSDRLRIDNPRIQGEHLVVSDTREDSTGWTLTAKLSKELLNEDGKTSLKDAIRYKSGKKELFLNDQALPIIRKEMTSYYDISEDWHPTGDGFKLEVSRRAISGALGKYDGEILFELGATP
ncbi:hypothetical protein [Enterococcus rotai]|uniref:hypothetical protein n=1 Tax=Enterococcus rotai TaxID=118060 RepID=UPI0032B40114